MQMQTQQADPLATTIAQALRILAECGRQRRQNNLPSIAGSVFDAGTAIDGATTDPTEKLSNGADRHAIIEHNH